MKLSLAMLLFVSFFIFSGCDDKKSDSNSGSGTAPSYTPPSYTPPSYTPPTETPSTENPPTEIPSTETPIPEVPTALTSEEVDILNSLDIYAFMTGDCVGNFFGMSASSLLLKPQSFLPTDGDINAEDAIIIISDLSLFKGTFLCHSTCYLFTDTTDLSGIDGISYFKVYPFSEASKLKY